MGLRSLVACAALAAGLATPAVALQAVQVEGAWRNPNGGTCEAPMWRSGDGSRSTRGETAIKGTIVNAGVTITGDLVLEGMRRGQFVAPETDRAIFLVDTPMGRVRVIPMALEYRSWGENGIVLEKCP
jgi:hypothetical protein